MERDLRKNRRHLRIVEALELPRTLGEYAGCSNIDAGLYEKLGADSLWLFANEMYGIARPNETIADYLGKTEGIAVPVRYLGLRSLSAIEDLEEYREEKLAPVTFHFPTPFESVAVFRIDPDVELEGEGMLESGDNVTNYAEVAVRLGQPVVLLEQSEYIPGSTRLPSKKRVHSLELKNERPLRIVRNDEW